MQQNCNNEYTGPQKKSMHYLQKKNEKKKERKKEREHIKEILDKCLELEHPPHG
jgi:hypothetical protein